MRCSGCGKKVPFGGKVCPYCQRDKSSDQAEHGVAIILGFPLAFGGAYFFGFWGFVVGIVAAVVASSMMTKNASKPPEVQVVNQRATIGHDTTDEIRLVKLKQLFERKLIDAAEYDKKRNEILQSM
jgi:hypothetical protein